MISLLCGLFVAAGSPQDKARTKEISFRVSGVCVDEAGEPVVNAQVQVWRSIARDSDRLFQVKSDQDGRFEIAESIPEPSRKARFWLVVKADGRAPATTSINPRAAKDPLKLTLPKGPITLRGRVLGPDDQPLQGAQVYLPGGPPHEVGVRSTTTGADGKFVLSDVDSFENYQKQFTGIKVTSRWLLAQHPDLGSIHVDVTSESGDLLFHFDRPSIVEGRVVEKATGKPVAGVDIWMQGVEKSTWWETTTDMDGRYRMPSQVVEPFNICLDDTTRWTARAIAGFRPEARRSATAPDLELIEGGWIDGQLVDESTGRLWQLKEGETLDVGLYGPSRPQPGAAIEVAPVGRNGAFRMRVAPGSNRLYIPRLDIRGEVTVEVGEGETVKATIRVSR